MAAGSRESGTGSYPCTTRVTKPRIMLELNTAIRAIHKSFSCLHFCEFLLDRGENKIYLLAP